MEEQKQVAVYKSEHDLVTQIVQRAIESGEAEAYQDWGIPVELYINQELMREPDLALHAKALLVEFQSRLFQYQLDANREFKGVQEDGFMSQLKQLTEELLAKTERLEQGEWGEAAEKLDAEQRSRLSNYWYHYLTINMRQFIGQLCMVSNGEFAERTAEGSSGIILPN